MTIEADIKAVLAPLVAGRVFSLRAPLGTSYPLITRTQVGGDSINFLAGVPDLTNANMQISCHAKTSAEATALMRQAAVLMKAAPLDAEAISEPVDLHDEDTDVYTVTQDFSVWFYP